MLIYLVLNSQTWENIMTHIQPVAREELHTTFYGNILRNFSRSLKVYFLLHISELFLNNKKSNKFYAMLILS